MGIAPYKTFTFGGKSSADYGVYITGEGVFNAPERAVEMVDIPGRNGSYAMDQGRFSNIEVTYNGGMVDDNVANFADRMSAFRNWLCSKKGYVRLEDDYNPDEYRMAVYSSGISVEHADLRTGEFEISFDCKPQRWLTSGETATAVANNGTLTNPTLFDAEPLLEVKGYGGIHFNGFDVDIQNVTLGDIIIADTDSFDTSKTYTFDSTLFNSGNSISVSGEFECICNGETSAVATYTDSDASFTSIGSTWFLTNFSFSFTAGTDSTKTNTLSVSGTRAGVTQTWTITQTVQYIASTGTITMSLSGSTTTTDNTKPATINLLQGQKINIIGHSTASALGNPTYIDCEIGEAYMYKGTNIVSCNQVVALGSDLPKLAPGANTITYDNTITDLKIYPRWWRV